MQLTVYNRRDCNCNLDHNSDDYKDSNVSRPDIDCHTYRYKHDHTTRTFDFYRHFLWTGCHTGYLPSH